VKRMGRPLVIAVAWGATLCVACLRALAGGDELPLAEEAALREAALRVAGAVVRIEATGVSEAALAGAAEAAPASGPSTGLVVEEGGWVLTTSFAVPQDAREAVVVVPDTAATEGRGAGAIRRVAKAVGRDVSRGLVLLRCEGLDLPAVAAVAPRAELAVGQWTIAVGRTWNPAVPSVAVGILSAVNRSWGRSVQTDASISPANYGGPLVDIEGRVIGILAPLPADTAGMNLGTELYDSGIGFAVPLEDVLRVLPRLKNGETLVPGVLGIGYRSRDPFTGEARIAACRPGSPAALAGLEPGDLIVAAAGRPVTRIAEVRHVLAPLYAGDSVRLGIERAPGASAAPGTAPTRLEVDVELAKSLPPWRRPFLGIVPERTAGRESKPKPVTVAWVWPGSPAAREGIAAGDVIEAMVGGGAAGEEVKVESPAALAESLAGVEAERPVGLVVSRQGTRRTASLTASAMSGDVPAEVPAFVPRAAGAPAGDAATIEKLEAAELANPPLVVLPNLAPEETLGVLVFLDVPRGAVGEAEAAAWKGAAARHGVAVVLPGSADPKRWGREDIAVIKRSLSTLSARRAIDPTRIAVAGRGAGGAFGWLVAEALGGTARGVALIDAVLPRQATVEQVEPGRSRWVLFGGPAGKTTPGVEAARRRLLEAGHVVGALPVEPGAAVPAETLAGWVESLGSL
jgi:serine protease Do